MKKRQPDFKNMQGMWTGNPQEKKSKQPVNKWTTTTKLIQWDIVSHKSDWAKHWKGNGTIGTLTAGRSAKWYNPFGEQFGNI